jgi:lysophospholipase L1-like esterase
VTIVLTVVGVMGERGGPTWLTVVASGISGALLAGTVSVVAFGGPEPVQSAAAAVPAVTTPAVAEEPPSVTFVGDSWTEGIGATALRGYAVLTGEQLGWEYDVLGVSGSGYSLKGRQGLGSTFGERIDRAVGNDPDIIVVQGSLNERNSTLEALAPAAMETLARLRAEADPDTQIVVLGAPYNPGTPTETIDWINSAIEAAAVAAGVEFVDVAELNWTDPADPTVWADPIHPNDAGYRLIADQVTSMLREMADA